MDLTAITPQQVQAFLLCLARISALIAAIPALTGGQITVRLKVGLAVMTTFLLFPAMAPLIPAIPTSMTGFGLVLVNEALLGLLLGLITQMILAAISFGGTIIGYQMGFAAANLFDPQTTQQTSLLSQFVNVLSLLVFLSLNMHHVFFQAMVDSYRLLPPGLLDFTHGGIQELMRLASHMFVLGITFSAPVLALLLLTNLVLGILARVFPQLNVFMLSFPLNIGISFLVIGLTLTATMAILRREFDTHGELMLHLVQMLR